MWAGEPECQSIVENSQTSSVSAYSLNDIMQNIDTCSNRLSLGIQEHLRMLKEN